MKSHACAVLVFHQGSCFERDSNRVLVYPNKKIDKFPEMNVDLVSLFDFVRLFKGLGYYDYNSMM